MTALPRTTPVPTPVFMPQTSNAASAAVEPESPSEDSQKSKFALPKLRLELRDIMHPGAKVFLKSVVPSIALEFAVTQVLELLYQSPECKTTKVPGTRSVTVIIRSMEGVAYTTGTELDNDHKEIHFSAEYIDNPASRKRAANEILGVLTHEMVHCYQYNAHGTCPGGLIEGIADWVRLNSGLSPPHWKQEWAGKKWDAGYQTTAYFLAYLEDRYGNGTIRRLNEKLRTDKYEEKRFWTELLGRPVEQLWADYGKAFDKFSKRISSDDDLVVVEKDDSEATKKAGQADVPTTTKKAEGKSAGKKSPVGSNTSAQFQPTLI